MAWFCPNECEACTSALRTNQIQCGAEININWHCKKSPKIFDMRRKEHDVTKAIACPNQSTPTEWVCARTSKVTWDGISYCNLFNDSLCNIEECPDFKVPIGRVRS
jgi:superfamily I DNA and RNA helicase